MYKQNLYLQTVIVILIKLLQLLSTSGRSEKCSLNKTYFTVKVIQDNYQRVYPIV
jgi:hypothetical protein